MKDILEQLQAKREAAQLGGGQATLIDSTNEAN